MPKSHAVSIKDAVAGILIFVGIIWAVYVADLFLPLEQLGLVPRSLGGLTGIVAMPFLHGNLQHIIGNTTPLVFLLMLLAGSRANSWSTVVFIVILSGVLLWIFGRGALHIGASGLVFGLISFLVFAGIFERRFVPLLISVLVGVIYGVSFFIGLLPLSRGVSWDGHLCGGVAGVVAAWFLTNPRKS